MTENERIKFALTQVDMIYSGIREHFEGGATKCWDDDPWGRGVSSYYKPGEFRSLLPHVARPEVAYILRENTPQCGSTAGCKERSSRAIGLREK